MQEVLRNRMQYLGKIYMPFEAMRPMRAMKEMKKVVIIKIIYHHPTR
jgi:hypothetical protein